MYAGYKLGFTPSSNDLAQTMTCKLVVHASASIRIAALSFLTFSSLSTRALSEDELCMLQERIPLFHTENDPKDRSHFLSITKQLLGRLKGAMFRLTTSKNTLFGVEGEVQDLFPTASLCVASILQSSCRSTFITHFNFLEWYMSFLVQELQPTSSYGRHITALKVMHIMFSSDLRLYLQVLAIRDQAQKNSLTLVGECLRKFIDPAAA